MLGRVLITQGRLDEAKKIQAELETPPINNDKLYASAIIKNFLGQDEEAFKIFSQLIDQKYGVLVYMKVERSLFNNKNEAKYNELVKRMGL